MVMCIGLTGSIASGKSTVAKAFAKRGIEVICSDTIAKQLTSPHQPALQSIVYHFGETVLFPSGELNRRALRDIIFKHPDERIWLENLLHPLIRQTIEQRISSVKSAYCIIEIPLLYQKSDYPYLHRILVVSTPESIAITRIMQRDNCSKKDAKTIIDNQNKRFSFNTIADDFLVNNHTTIHLDEIVEQLHQQYMDLAFCL